MQSGTTTHQPELAAGLIPNLPPCVLADEFMAGEEEVGDDGGGGEADGAFDYSTLAEAMDASGSGSDADTDDGAGDAGIDGLGGGPGAGSPPDSGAWRIAHVIADTHTAYACCHWQRTACHCSLRMELYSCTLSHSLFHSMLMLWPARPA